MEPFGTSEETRAIVAEIDRFARRVIAPRVTRPERPLPAGELGEILDAARAMGILPAVSGDELGLWGAEGEGALRSVLVLERISRVSTAVALAAHQTSAARRIAVALGFDDAAGDGVLAVDGRFGVGRDALARWLVGAPLTLEDRALLGDVYAFGEARLCTALPGFAWILAPAMEADGTVQWALHRRAALEITTLPHAHGLDELPTFSFRPTVTPVAALTRLDPAAARERLAEALALASLGLVAVAAGAAARGHAIARAHAETRRQGGAILDDHAAVKLLLASSRGAIDAVRAHLAEAAQRAPGLGALGSVLGMRAEAHPLLCRAANDALQVLGGTGYMRDAGAEKVLRDVGHLRALAGSPPELALFVAEWERLHA